MTAWHGGLVVLSKIKLAFRIGIFSICVLVFNVPFAHAVTTTNDLTAIVNGTPYYDPGAIGGCGPGASGISTTLPDGVPEPHKSLFTKASQVYGTNPNYIAALFLSEHSNTWLPFDSDWGTSRVGAAGPFQFMPGTWSAYQADGDGDGKKDIQNMYDATYAAANMAKANGISPDTPLGDINKPFKKGTILYAAASYNWGGGNVQKKTTEDSSLDDPDVPKETQHYISNVYNLIFSQFTKGGTSYPDPHAPDQPKDKTSSAEALLTSNCAGAVSGSAVQTAVNYAWPDYHPPNYLEMKPSYAEATKTAQAEGKYVGGGNHPGIDCGGFVTRVMQNSGLDPNYNSAKGPTEAQEQYMKNHPELYEQIHPKSTADMQPGDIAINNDHTYMYVGTVSGFNSNTASASFSTSGHSWRAPMAGKETPADSDFRWYRHK